jgi:hypothetical protein
VIHLRLVVPADLAEQVLVLLRAVSSALNLIHLPGAARSPEGDLVLVDVPREDASTVSRLQELGLGEGGTIATIEIDAAVSKLAVAAEQAAAGSPADAVVWEQVEARTSETAVLSGSFLAFMILATLIAAVGIVTDSIILIIGAMIVGPGDDDPRGRERRRRGRLRRLGRVRRRARPARDQPRRDRRRRPRDAGGAARCRLAATPLDPPVARLDEAVERVAEQPDRDRAQQ